MCVRIEVDLVDIPHSCLADFALHVALAMAPLPMVNEGHFALHLAIAMAPRTMVSGGLGSLATPFLLPSGEVVRERSGSGSGAKMEPFSA